MADDNANYNMSIKNRIRTFENQFSRISKSIEIYGRYNTWVHFECNGLVLDTANPKNKNLILQTWEYNKNGSGTANNFTLRICYNFSEASEMYNLPDIHYVEEALCLDKIVENPDGSLAGFLSAADKLSCRFRYGYINVGSESDQILSPEYEGQITGCTPELRDNMLFYTITGVSGVFGGKDAKFSFQKIEGWKATDLAWDVLNKYYGSGYADNGLKYTINKPYKIINKTATSGIRTKEREQNFDPVNGDTVFGYVTRVLKSAKYHDEDELSKIPDDEKPYCTFYVDDYEHAIVIDVVDPKNTINNGYYSNENVSENDSTSNNSDSVNYDTSVVFEYPNKNQNFILSFTPSFDLKTVWSGVIYSDKNKARWGIDEGGNLLVAKNINESGFLTVTKTTDTTAVSGSVISSNGSGTNDTTSNGPNKENVPDSNTTKEDATAASTFSEAVNQEYSATLSCLGIPADIPIQTRLKIVPILNGSPYMFQGSYMVKTCSDRIDSSGFITEMSLFRLKTNSTNK